MTRDPVVLCKFNKEIFTYLGKNSIPVVYVEDKYDADMFSTDVETFNPIARYKVNDLNSLSELMVVASEIKIEFPKAKLVISPNEFSQYAAAVIRTALDDSANSLFTTLCTRDKGLMKAVLSANNVPVAPGFSLGDNDVEAVIAKIKSRMPYPLILKPRSAMSSQGVFKIVGDDDLHWSIASLNADGQLGSYLCEEYIAGDEYFVDAVWSKGSDWKILVGKYDVPMLDVARGRGLVISRYINREENPAVYDEIVKLSRKAAAACEVSDGVTHTEFFVDKENNVFLGEMATRMGGGPHEELAKWATGWSLGELQARALLGDLEETPPDNLPMDSSTFGYINLQPNKPGIVERVLSEGDVLNHPGVIRVTKSSKAGDTFSGNGSSSWFLCCILSAESGSRFEDHSRSLADSFFSQLAMT